MSVIRSLSLAALVVAGVCAAARAHARAPSPSDDDWFGRDKALHFGASALISSTAYGVTTALDDRRAVALAVGGGVALAAGVAKESYDALGYGTPSWKDLAWDVVGTVVGLAVAYGVDALIRREPPARATASAALVRF